MVLDREDMRLLEIDCLSFKSHCSLFWIVQRLHLNLSSLYQSRIDSAKFLRLVKRSQELSSIDTLTACRFSINLIHNLFYSVSLYSAKLFRRNRLTYFLLHVYSYKSFALHCFKIIRGY